MIDPRRPDFTNVPGSPGRPALWYRSADVAAPPLVSVVTPFFDAGSEFEETARSVLGQSLQQIEWIVVDDGSRDPGALAMLDRYRRHDPRIRVIGAAENRGLSSARNAGVAAARAPYVVLLDADDLLEATALEKWWWCLESYPELAFTKGYSIGFGGREYLWRRGFHETAAFLEQNMVDATAMIRTGTYRAVGGCDETVRDGLEDWDFWLRCAAAGHWGGTVPEYLNWYRRRIDHGDRWRNLGDMGRLQDFRVRLRERYPRLWREGFPRLELEEASRYGALPECSAGSNRLGGTKRRLLLVVPRYALGGVDRFNLDLIRQLSGRGWEVSVVATLPGPHPWLPEFAAVTPDVFVPHHFLRAADYPRFLSYLVASRGVDVVLVTNSRLGYHLTPYLRRRHPGVAFAGLEHIEERWQNGGFPRMLATQQDVFDLAIAVSRHLADWMVARGADPRRTRVAHCAVDTTEWRPDASRRAEVRAALGVDSSTVIILYAGRICPQKRPEVFVETVRHLRAEGRRFLAVVAGDGPERGWLEDAVSARGLGACVRLLGEVPIARVRALMQAADIVFLPSAHEGVALVLYEAMACGACVVAADVGGQRELVATGCGVLLRPLGDLEAEGRAYAAAIAGLIDRPDEREALARRALDRVREEFDAAGMGQRMSRLLEEALHLHDMEPRTLPAAGLASTWASEAIEAAREEGRGGAPALLAACGEPDPGGGDGHLLDPYRASPRTLAYFAMRGFLLPLYRWATERGGVRWLAPLKERTKHWLLTARGDRHRATRPGGDIRWPSGADAPETGPSGPGPRPEAAGVNGAASAPEGRAT